MHVLTYTNPAEYQAYLDDLNRQRRDIAAALSGTLSQEEQERLVGEIRALEDLIYARSPYADYLEAGECERGVLYYVNARNFHLAVCDGENGFVGIREKFGREYLDTEYHYDTGRMFGTCRPKFALGLCPVDDLREGWPHPELPKQYVMNKRLFRWLQRVSEAFGYTAPEDLLRKVRMKGLPDADG